MSRYACFLGAVILFGSQAVMWAQDEAPASRKLPDGVYAVRRDSVKEKDVLPLKGGEILAVHHHRYLKNDAKEPPRFLVVRSEPQVTLDPLIIAPISFQNTVFTTTLWKQVRCGTRNRRRIVRETHGA